MSDEAHANDGEASGGCFKKALVGAMVVVVGLGVLFLIMTIRARAVIAENIARANDALQRLESRPIARPVTFGAPRAGNAVWDYNALEWVLGPRPTWKNAPANLPKLPYGRDHFNKQKPMTSEIPHLIWIIESDPKYQAEWARLHGSKPRKGLKDKDIKAARAFYAKHGANLLAPVDMGMSRKDCDWELDRTIVFDSPIPSLLALRSGANLLAYRAHVGGAREAVDSGLKAVALGRDVDQVPSLIGSMIGIALRSIGYLSLERTLRRPLNEAQCRRVIEVLNKLGKVDLELMFLDERTCQDMFLARLAGHGKPIQSNSGFEGLLTSNSVFLAREWGACNDLWDPAVTGASGSYKAFAKAQREIDYDSLRYHPIARVMVPSFFEALKHALEANAFHDCCLIGAAAKLHRLETGKWPGQVEELKKYLGEIPKDPYTDRSKPYEIKAEGLNFVVKTRDKGQDFDRTIAIRVRASK